MFQDSVDVVTKNYYLRKISLKITALFLFLSSGRNVNLCVFLVTALSEVEEKSAADTIRYRVVCALYLRGQLVRCICDEGAARNGVPEYGSTLKAIQRENSRQEMGYLKFK
jgi:hypothetical protein